MKPGFNTLRLLLLAAAIPLLSNCATNRSKPQAPAAVTDPRVTTPLDGATDSRDDYGATTEVSDPLEPVNRAMFSFNDGVYNYVLRPISKGYVAVFPTPIRKGVDNVFDNAKFPVRFVNSGLQGKFKRAGLEAGKFAVNTIAGFGGILRSAEKVPALANLPAEDTGQTLGKWGLGHGPYMVLPILGPSTARDTVGLAGDYVLNPTHWSIFARNPSDAWTWIPGSADTLRSLPIQLDYYDESRKNSVDPYLSVRSIYVQNRNSATND